MQSTFENHSIDTASLPPVEESAFISLSTKRAWIESFYLILGLVLPVLTALIILTLAGVLEDHVNTAFVLPLIILGLSLLIILLHFEARKRAYTLRTHDLLYKAGIIFKKHVAVPINRIQHVEVSRPFLDRKCGLASLGIFTAGAGGVDVVIPGLGEEDALRLQAHLLKRISQETLEDVPNA